MTIKEAELLVGITRANIRFYEKEGLLAPGRGANNYREYSEADVERLKKIRILRMMGISVSDIGGFIEGKHSLSGLLEQRVREIEREETALLQIKELCSQIRAREWEFDTMDPEMVELRLRQMNVTGGIIMKRDKIDKWCRLRDMAYLFCFLCILSMIMFPVNVLLGIKVPEGVLTVWVTIIGLSPFPALILWSLTAARARWGVPDMDRILPESGSTLKKMDRDRGKWYMAAARFNQICLISLLALPINRMFHITLPLWALGLWIAVVCVSVVLFLAMRNATAGR